MINDQFYSYYIHNRRKIQFVSDIMLQQTQAEMVLKKYGQFIKRMRGLKEAKEVRASDIDPSGFSL